MKNGEELFDKASNIVDELTNNSEYKVGDLKIIGLLVHELMTDYLNSPEEDSENYICSDCEDKMMGNKKDETL